MSYALRIFYSITFDGKQRERYHCFISLKPSLSKAMFASIISEINIPYALQYFTPCAYILTAYHLI